MAYDTGGLLDSIGIKLQNHPRYTRALKLDGLNRAIEALISFASEDYDVKEVSNPLDPSDSSKYALEWPLPDNCLFVASVSFDGYPLRPCTQQEYVKTRAEFSVRVDDPAIYYIRANRYLNVWPRPGRQATVQLYGLMKPDDLVLDADPIPLNRVFSPAMTSYAAWWCLQGQTGEENRCNQFLADYLRERAEAKFNLTQNTTHKLQRAR